MKDYKISKTNKYTYESNTKRETNDKFEHNVLNLKF